MLALAVFLLLAPPAPARAPEPVPAPSWGELAPTAAPPTAAPTDAPIDAVPTPTRTDAAPATPPPVVQPPPAALPPVVQPAPPPEKPRPDRPIRRRIDLKLEAGLTRLDSPKWYAAAWRRHDATFGASVDLDLRPGGGRVYIGPTLGFRMWGEADSVHDALFVSLAVRELLAGARLSIAAVDGVDAFVQARGGPVFVRRDIGGGFDASSSFYAAGDRAITGGGEAIGGLSVYLPKRWLPRKGAARVTAGFETALGYAYRGAVEIRAKADTAEDDIPTKTADFGSIPLRGLVWHVGLFVRFM